MDDVQKRVLPLYEAYRFGAECGLEAKVNEIRNMEIEWDKSYTSSVRRGYIIELFEANEIFSQFKERYWPSGNTPFGEALKRRYQRIKASYEEFLAGDDSGGIDGDREDSQEESSRQFALEAHLRDFLARNLDRIEPGLRLYHAEVKSGIEFQIDDGRIDILAVDREDRFLVIELKLSRGRNKTIGQLLYYMGWVDKNLGNAPCRGMIIANEITNDLVLAVQRVQGVSLCRYHLSVSVERIHN